MGRSLALRVWRQARHLAGQSHHRADVHLSGRRVGQPRNVAGAGAGEAGGDAERPADVRHRLRAALGAGLAAAIEPVLNGGYLCIERDAAALPVGPDTKRYELAWVPAVLAAGYGSVFRAAVWDRLLLTNGFSMKRLLSQAIPSVVVHAARKKV